MWERRFGVYCGYAVFVDRKYWGLMWNVKRLWRQEFGWTVELKGFEAWSAAIYCSVKESW
jgi:hypothetical protein